MTTWTRFWKVERQRAPWVAIPDTEEALQAAIQRGAMFCTVLSLNGPPDDPQTNRRGPLALDFDSADDPVLSLIEMAWSVALLEEEYRINPDRLGLFLSGGKGGHIIVPESCLGLAPSPDLHKIHKNIAARLQAELELATLDLSLYAGGKGKMLRLPNVQRSTGRYKVRISWTELCGLSARELEDLTRRPRALRRVAA